MKILGLPLFFRLPKDSNKRESDKIKKCLSVGNFVVLYLLLSLSVSSLLPTPAYVEACNIYYISIVYFLDYPNIAGFLFLRHFVWAVQKHCFMTEINGTCVW